MALAWHLQVKGQEPAAALVTLHVAESTLANGCATDTLVVGKRGPLEGTNTETNYGIQQTIGNR